MFLRYAPSCRMLHDAFPSLTPTFPDYHFSTILPLPARQHSSDQSLAFLPLLLSPLSSAVWFFLIFRRRLSISFAYRRSWFSALNKPFSCIIALVPLTRDLRAPRINSGRSTTVGHGGQRVAVENMAHSECRVLPALTVYLPDGSRKLPREFLETNAEC